MRCLKCETNLLMKPGNQKALIRHFQLTRNACRVEEFVITHSCVGESVCLCLLWCANGLRVKTDTLYLLSSFSAPGCSRVFFISLSWLSFWFSLKWITHTKKSCFSNVLTLWGDAIIYPLLCGLAKALLWAKCFWHWQAFFKLTWLQISSPENRSVQDFTGTSALRLLIKDTDWLKRSSRCLLKCWLEPWQIEALSRERGRSKWVQRELESFPK